MKKNVFCKILFSIIALIFVFTISLPIVKAAKDEEDKEDVYCIICTKDKDDPLYKKERQFNEKIRIIKGVFGDSIDEVVLAAAVLHRYGQNFTYNVEYSEDFNSSDYRSMWSNILSSKSKESVGESGEVEISSEEEERIKENEKIDLLTTAAIVMIDSNHLGKYSDACFKDGLAGDGLVGNTSQNNSFTALQNALFCSQYQINNVLEAINPFTFIRGLFSEDSFLVTGLSQKNRIINTSRVCENGYVGGLYSNVFNTTDEEEQKKLKNYTAQEIINFANYYKLHYGELEQENSITCPVGEINGTTQGSQITGDREQRIEQIGPAAQAVYSQTGVFASVTIAQAIEESQIGAAGEIALGNNNLFGIKCRDGLECKNGYAVYSSIEEGIADHAKVFANGMYPGWDSAKTPEEQIRIVGPTYCPVSDGCGDYAGRIISLINDHNLKRWDVKQNVSSNGSCGTSNSVGGFDIRTIAPVSSDASFVEMESVNNNYSNRGQCVWYARGRAYEIVNSLKDSGKLNDNQASHIKELLARAYGNGGEIYDNAKSVFNSSNDIKKPKAGSYIVWKKPGSYGHVAIVEEVNTTSNTITITGGYTSTGSCPSNWDCIQFTSKTMSLDEFYNSYGQHYIGGYVFSGYVYFLEPLDMKDAWTSIDSSSTTCGSPADLISSVAVAVAPDAQTKPGQDVHIYEPNAWPWNKVDEPKLEPFFNLMDAAYASGGNKAYASCAQAAAAIIRATVDPDFETENPKAQEKYLKKNTEKWTFVGKVKAGESIDEKCQPGDLLITNVGWNHTLIYVGNAAARRKFPNTIGNVWFAGYNERDHARYPAIDYIKSFPVDFNIYRATGNGTFKNKFINLSDYVDLAGICSGYSQSNQVCVNGSAVQSFSSEDSSISDKTGKSIAELAINVVPTATPESPIISTGDQFCKVRDPRLYNYYKIMDATIGPYPSHDSNNTSRRNGINNNLAYASCAQAVAGIVRAAVDPDFESGNPEFLLDYFEQNKEKWNMVSRLKAGEKYESVCQPGDVIILEGFNNHTMIYVGNELVRQRFPDSDGDMYEASYEEKRYPTIKKHIKVKGSYARVYRYTGNGNSYYKPIDIESVLAGEVDLKNRMC